MKISRLASYVFIGSLFAIVMIWGYLPRVWLMGWPQLVLLGLSGAGLVAWFIFSLEGIRLWMKKRSTQFAIGLAITAFMSVVLLSTVNWLANSYNVKKDLTQNQLHTLSDQTKKIASGLKENVSLRLWSTSPERMSANLDVKRFLEGYVKASNGKISFEIKSPNEDRPGAAADNIKRDNIIIVKSASGRESRVENFSDTKAEELVTNAIVQAVKGQKKTVCFLAGHGEISLNESDAQGLSTIKGQLTGSSYEVKEVMLAGAEKLPADCEALVVAGPRSEAVERETKMLREYLETGGKMIALLGPGTPTGWRKFAGEWGVNVRSDLIIDPRVQPPIAIATKNFAQDIEVVKAFNRMVVLPETSSIEVDAKPKEGSTIRTFISSESYTFAKTGDLKALATKGIRQQGSDLRGPLPVAVLVEKPIASAKNEGETPAGKPAPLPKKPAPKAESHGRFRLPSLVNEAVAQDHSEVGHDDGDDPLGAPTGSNPPAKDGPKPVKTEMSLIVFSNHNFVMNSFVSQLGNMDLFLNAVNYLLKDQDLIGIRPREIRQASLELNKENLRQVYATVLLIAGFFLVGGILAKRRKGTLDV